MGGANACRANLLCPGEQRQCFATAVVRHVALGLRPASLRKQVLLMRSGGDDLATEARTNYEVVERIRARKRRQREGQSKSSPASAMEPGAPSAVRKPIPRAPMEITQRVVDIIQKECPTYGGKVTPIMLIKDLEGQADSLDILETMLELEEVFKVELEDEEVKKVCTVSDLADLIYRTPRGHRLRSVDDEAYLGMIKRAHSENRWGELY